MTRGEPNDATVSPIVNGKALESAAFWTDLMLSSLVSSIYKQHTITTPFNAH